MSKEKEREELSLPFRFRGSNYDWWVFSRSENKSKRSLYAECA